MRISLAIIAACSTLASAESRPRYGGSVEGSLLGAPVTLDPALAQAHAELTAVELVFDTLYRIGPAGIVQPHLAIDAPVIEGNRARITIRSGVKFHDGSELTAADVAASLERLRATPASRWVVSPVSAVRADGPVVELTLKGAVPELATLLALPATAVTRGGRPPGEKPIGSGPFKVGSLDITAKKLTLDAFDEHFAGRPYLDQLVLRWYDTPDAEARQFERGSAHLSARGAAAFTGAQPKYRADDVEGPAALLVFVGFGRAHMDVTSDRNFRRAVDFALARGALASVGSGERVSPSRLPVPVEAGAPVLDTGGRAADLLKAKAALALAAKSVKALEPTRLPQLKLEILVEDTRPDDREVAERVAYALNKLGIASVITAVPAATLRDRVRRGACDLFIGQLAAPVSAATAWWGGAFAIAGDAWAEQQLSTGSLDRAAAVKAFADRLPILPLAFRAVRIWHRTDVRGLGFDASGRPSYADLFLFGDPSRNKGKP